MATIRDVDITKSAARIRANPKSGEISAGWAAVVCPACKEPHIKFSLAKSKTSYGNMVDTHFYGKLVQEWSILPESVAKPLPSYVPKVISDDYFEACLILNKSPKASATLSRRCLQGMIRDFWNIKKGRLIDEIRELGKLHPATAELIDPVRKLGNIGAHMEKDVNLIIDVEPDEAQLLIELLEQLFEDWYIDRYVREKRKEKLISSAAKKDLLKSPPIDAA